jgi:hypothetical protein
LIHWPGNFPGGTEENHLIINQDTQCIGKDFNQETQKDYHFSQLAHEESVLIELMKDNFEVIFCSSNKSQHYEI